MPLSGRQERSTSLKSVTNPSDPPPTQSRSDSMSPSALCAFIFKKKKKPPPHTDGSVSIVMSHDPN